MLKEISVKIMNEMGVFPKMIKVASSKTGDLNVGESFEPSEKVSSGEGEGAQLQQSSENSSDHAEAA